uniref:CAAX prenyl protease 2/Lysostaphin resistance protein A-like domain-containing protein n=1 Tax=Leersia perrieri TaxID=77586 RepID=A0A0D9WEQ4_9ORYZ
MEPMTLAPTALSLRDVQGWKCQITVPTWKRLHNGPRNGIRTFAAKSNERKRRKSQSISKGPTLVSEDASSSSGENPTTSLEVSHFACSNGWPVADPMDLSFNFEIWHLELVAGLVIVVSSSRYILLQTWSDFRNSSEAANRQILTSLETFDYILVACLPGISEELLFRGALMPIFGLNWIGALVTGAIFGVLHLGNGRKYSFAVWATFVGVAYGLATLASSSIIVSYRVPVQY